MMTATVVWKPDYFDNFNHVVRYFANGWTVTAIWTANSGQPFTITTGVDNYFSGNGNNRVSVVPGKTPRVLDNNGSRATAMNQWFDTSAFCRPGVDAGCPGVGPLGLLGNFRAATLDSPGYRNIDTSIFKDFALFREGVKFQIRGESTNVFNLTNLGQPTAAANNTNYGKVTSTSGNNRIIQVGGRILF